MMVYWVQYSQEITINVSNISRKQLIFFSGSKMFYIKVDVLQTGATTVVVNRETRFLNSVFEQRSYFVTCARSGHRGKN